MKDQTSILSEMFANENYLTEPQDTDLKEQSQ